MAKGRTKKEGLAASGWFDGSFSSKPKAVQRVGKSIARNQAKNDKQNFASFKKKNKRV